MAEQYGTVITTEGASKIAACVLQGTKMSIAQAAAGDGGGAYYLPTPDMAALKNETWRGDIASAELSVLTPNMIDVKIVIPDDVGGFIIREMALFDEDGVMIAICNTPATEKVAITGGVSGQLTMVMHIVVADASVIQFIINPSLDTIGRDDLDAAILNHNASSTCHADIRQLALNSVQQGDVYTKTESDTQISDAIAAHNAADDAHPPLQVHFTELDSRLLTLELKYGADVTGNSFEVAFTSLTDVAITGVWNEAYGRVEF